MDLVGDGGGIRHRSNIKEVGIVHNVGCDVVGMWCTGGADGVIREVGGMIAIMVIVEIVRVILVVIMHIFVISDNDDVARACSINDIGADDNGSSGDDGIGELKIKTSYNEKPLSNRKSLETRNNS
ncbi:Hypothetical predicted protein [Octopus vulgaris]|uniref:Uncharacterized protein n=1 Tax=Octopus vulgaris TaxID=6645 RepID=A0AA36F289_OCTVU|nr:Hypothetical predicted protein [Octopus vulgaris]